MDVASITALVVAITGLIGAVAKLWMDMRQTKQDYNTIWKGIVERGFLEAEELRVIIRIDGESKTYMVAENARQIYNDIAEDLKRIRKKLKDSMGKEPSNEVLAWAIERDFQAWMIANACPKLGVNQHGCLAIACILARENGTNK